MDNQHDDTSCRSEADHRISRRTALRGLGGTGVALAGSGMFPGITTAAQTATPAGVEQEAVRPNILVIIVDEMRDWQWFPDQEVLNERFPNMARLQDGAVRFGRHYTSSNMCSPSRGSLLTGLYSHQTGFVLTQGSNADTLQGGTASEAAPMWPPLDPRHIQPV